MQKIFWVAGMTQPDGKFLLRDAAAVVRKVFTGLTATLVDLERDAQFTQCRRRAAFWAVIMLCEVFAVLYFQQWNWFIAMTDKFFGHHIEPGMLSSFLMEQLLGY
jgi:hypothetical protein